MFYVRGQTKLQENVVPDKTRGKRVRCEEEALSAEVRGESCESPRHVTWNLVHCLDVILHEEAA